MTLQSLIETWDGKTASVVQGVYQDHSGDPGFADTLFSLLQSEPAQPGASWLIKAWLEQGNRPNDRQLVAFYDSLDSLTHWSSRLHVLQSLPFLDIPASHKGTLEHFLRSTLTDTNKFVRAWSYNGFYELACQYPEYREETAAFFDMALRDEAASVKARIRNLQKQGY